MKLPRPYISLQVRSRVVRRMLLEKSDWSRERKNAFFWIFDHLGSDAKRVLIGLERLGLTGAQLDHDPALCLRRYNPNIKNVAARYTPNANDPNALIYRRVDTHLEKTTGRKPGASRTVSNKGSDVGLKAKFAKLERPPKPKRQIGPRGFDAGPKRPIPSRPFQGREK